MVFPDPPNPHAISKTGHFLRFFSMRAASASLSESRALCRKYIYSISIASPVKTNRPGSNERLLSLSLSLSLSRSPSTSLSPRPPFHPHSYHTFLIAVWLDTAMYTHICTCISTDEPLRASFLRVCPPLHTPVCPHTQGTHLITAGLLYVCMLPYTLFRPEPSNIPKAALRYATCTSFSIRNPPMAHPDLVRGSVRFSNPTYR